MTKSIKIILGICLIILIGWFVKYHFFPNIENTPSGIVNNQSDVEIENQKFSLMCNDIEEVYAYYKNLDENFHSDCMSGQFSTNLFPKINDTDPGTMGFVECYSQSIEQNLSSSEEYQRFFQDCNDGYQMSHYNYVGGGTARAKDEAIAICDEKMQMMKFSSQEAQNNFQYGCYTYLYFFETYDEWSAKWNSCLEKYKKSNYNEDTIQDYQDGIDYCMNN